MDIIKRNFFRLLRSGALNEIEPIEPMSKYKWNHLLQMLKTQNVMSIALKGIENYQYNDSLCFLKDILSSFQSYAFETPKSSFDKSKLSNPIFNIKLTHIHDKERHAIDTSIESLELLNIIIHNVYIILNYGISLNEILTLGCYLRNKGDKVDFVKIDIWLQKLHLQRMAQLQGSILINFFNFSIEEIPFVHKIEPKAYNLTIRAVDKLETDTAKEWHFKQSKTGFVKNNSSVMKRNLRRSFRYIDYAPTETISNFVSNFAKSLSEIEE